MNLSWQTIRAIGGSQQDGFEELMAQLARSETHAHAKFERVGTADAGVECFCVFDDGSEWGWQAKFFTTSLTGSQWRQIDDSVETALRKHPNLVRYFVCIPWDRSDARKPSQKSAMQRWEERVCKWEGWAQERGMSVKFIWWGASELIERLSLPENIGRLLFWFDERYFDRAWYDSRLKEAVRAAGPRYTPEVQMSICPSRAIWSCSAGQHTAVNRHKGNSARCSARLPKYQPFEGRKGRTERKRRPEQTVQVKMRPS